MPITRIAGNKTLGPLKQGFIERIKIGKVVPIISNELANDLVLGGQTNLVKGYAEYIDYPLKNRHDLFQMTKFKRITTVIDDWELKSDYLNFVKNQLYRLAEAQGTSVELLAEAEEMVDDINFSEFSARLGYPKFSQAAADPLLILADLPLPIYLTSSYHNFVEEALKKAGKTPRSEICRWHEGLEVIPSVFDAPSLLEPEKAYQPTPQEPLVYHLHGFDERPDSLVLTEDDYLQFLVAISRLKGQPTDPIPRRIRQAISDSALILLGYDLDSWAFRVIFWGLIKSASMTNTGIFTIQLKPTPVEQKFFQDYLKLEAKLEVYWGDIYQYTRHLRDSLR